MNSDSCLYSLLVLRGLQGVSQPLPFPFNVLSHNFGTSCQTCILYCYVNLIVKVMYTINVSKTFVNSLLRSQANGLLEVFVQ